MTQAPSNDQFVKVPGGILSMEIQHQKEIDQLDQRILEWPKKKTTLVHQLKFNELQSLITRANRESFLLEKGFIEERGIQDQVDSLIKKALQTGHWADMIAQLEERAVVSKTESSSWNAFKIGVLLPHH
jgi:hypothetical protein